jgi:hypothetical protein
VKSSPREETDFVSSTSFLLRELKVIDGPSTFCLGKITDEVVVSCAFRGLLNYDLGVVVTESKDDVLCLLAKLEVLESAETILIYSNARGLRGE